MAGALVCVCKQSVCTKVFPGYIAKRERFAFRTFSSLLF